MRAATASASPAAPSSSRNFEVRAAGPRSVVQEGRHEISPARASDLLSSRGARRAAPDPRGSRARPARRRRACASARPPRRARAARPSRGAPRASRARCAGRGRGPSRGRARARETRASSERMLRGRRRRRSMPGLRAELRASCAPRRTALDEGGGDVVHLVVMGGGRRDGGADRQLGEGASPLRGPLDDAFERVRIGEHARGRDAVGRPGRGARLEAGRRAVGVQQPHARGGRECAGHDAMPAVSHRDVRAEALPGPPLVDATRQDLHAVDPHDRRALHGDDELAVSAAHEEGLGVEGPVLDLLVGHGKAGLLRGGKDVRHAPPHGIGSPGLRPGLGALSVEPPVAIRLRAVSEGSGEPHAPGAAHAPDDLVLVGLAGPLGALVDLDRPPVLEVGHRAPPDVPRVSQKSVERAAVAGEQIGHRAAQAREVPGRVPPDERRVFFRARRRVREGRQVGVGRRARVAVRLVDDGAGEARHHPAARGVDRVEPPARLRGVRGHAPGREHLHEGPSSDDLAVARRPRLVAYGSQRPRGAHVVLGSAAGRHARGHGERPACGGSGQGPHLNATIARCPMARSTSSHQVRNAAYSAAAMRVLARVTDVFTRIEVALTVTSVE